MLILALPATLALVPGHPYGRSLRPRAAADVRWPGVVAMAEGDGGKVPTKRADELLQALQARVGRPLRPHEAQAPTPTRNPAPTRHPDHNPAPPHSELMP